MEKSAYPTRKPVPSGARRHWWPFVLSSIILALAAAAVLLYQPIADHYTLKDANPQMIKLAQEAGMSRAGELIFLRTQPQLDTDKQIIKYCPASLANRNGYIEEGCYDSTANRIYLRRMPTNLYQAEVVTAAYELLHPIYISLSHHHQAALDQAIEAAYRSQLPNTSLSNLVGLFAKTEPGARHLELFSLLGTGYSNLPANLKQYYMPDFTNLAKVVAANTAVQALFQNYQSQLGSLQAAITGDKAKADAAYAQSVTWANEGNADEDTYYYNLYKQAIEDANAVITQYNRVLVGYNTLVVEYDGTQPVAPLQSLGSQPGQ